MYLQELDVMVDLTYNGGFELAVDVDLVLGKSAYLAIKLTKLSGTARLQLSRLPYTHWSFSFYEVINIIISRFNFFPIISSKEIRYYPCHI